MMSPNAQVQMSIDAAVPIVGSTVLAGGNVIQLSAIDTVGWTNQLWEIYEYPLNYPLPAGWINVNGVYQSTLVTPPPFTLSSAATRWGKYFWRLTVNNGLLSGIYMGPGAYPQQLVDESGGVSVLSPNYSLRDIGFRESSQFDGVRQWIGELKANLRLIDTVVGGGGGGFVPTGTGLIHIVAGVMQGAATLLVNADVSASAAIAASKVVQATGTGFPHVTAGALDAASVGLTWTGDTTGTGTGSSFALTTVKINGATVPVSGALVTGNVLQVSGAAALSYGPVNLAGGANFVTGLLPSANQAAQTLAGDVTGLSSATVVAKVNGATIPAAGALTTGNAPYVSGISALTYSALNLAGGAGWVTGVLPAANQAAQTMGGDVTGTTAVSVVAKVNGATVPAAGALVTGNAPYVSGISALTYSALNLAGGAGWVTGVLPSANAPSHTGDVTGTHAATVVAKINGATVPAAGALVTGNAPYVSGISALTYSALNLAGGAGWVTGVLPSANVASHTGDVTGAHSATVVAKVNGATVPASGALTTGNGLYVSGVAALTYSALNLAGGAGWVTGSLPLTNQGSPTGTGLAKVSAGAWVAAASLLVDADVNAAAAIAGTKISPNFGSQNVLTTGGMLLGTTPATTAGGVHFSHDMVGIKTLIDLSPDSGVTTYKFLEANATSLSIGTTSMYGAYYGYIASLYSIANSGIHIETDGALVIENFAILGARGTAATTGDLRLQSAASFVAANGAADLTALEVNAGALYLGTDSAFTGTKQFGSVNIYPTSIAYIGIGATTRFRVDGSGIAVYTPGDSLTFGYTGAAASGLIRLPSTGDIKALNNAGAADVTMLRKDSTDTVFLGGTGAYVSALAGGGCTSKDQGLGLITDLACYSQHLASNFAPVGAGPSDSNLDIIVLAGEVWEIEFNGYASCSTTNGMKYQIRGSATFTLSGELQSSSTNTTVTNWFTTSLVDHTFSAVCHAGATNAARPDSFKVRATVTGSGHIILAIGSVDAGATATLYAKSYWTARRSVAV